MPDSIRAAIDQVVSQLPFMAVVAGRPQVNVTRIIESLIIAAVVALASRFVIVAELKTEMQYVKKEVVEMKDDFDKDLDKVMSEIGNIKRDIYVPKFDTGN